MEVLDQGTVIHIQGQKADSLVLSRGFFNRTGMVIAAPVYSGGNASVLHIPFISGNIRGVVHLESMKGLDLRARYYKVLGKLSLEQIQDISDTAQDIFDYYPYHQGTVE